MLAPLISPSPEAHLTPEATATARVRKLCSNDPEAHELIRLTGVTSEQFAKIVVNEVMEIRQFTAGRQMSEAEVKELIAARWRS